MDRAITLMDLLVIGGCIVGLIIALAIIGMVLNAISDAWKH